MLSLTPLGDLTRFRRSNVKNEAYLITEDVSIKVHGIILAARSAKIEVMLIQNVNSEWYHSVCEDERYKGLMRTLDIPAPEPAPEPESLL